MQTEEQRQGLVEFDYTNQAWLEGGRYISCGHPDADCGCYGKAHAGEMPNESANIH